jgi:hypothetical protein
MVGEGATSGVAAKIDNRVAAINETNMGNERIGSDFDSIQRATFNAFSSCQSVGGATPSGAVEYALAVSSTARWSLAIPGAPQVGRQIA